MSLHGATLARAAEGDKWECDTQGPRSLITSPARASVSSSSERRQSLAAPLLTPGGWQQTPGWHRSHGSGSVRGVWQHHPVPRRLLSSSCTRWHRALRRGGSSGLRAHTRRVTSSALSPCATCVTRGACRCPTAPPHGTPNALRQPPPHRAPIHSPPRSPSPMVPAGPYSNAPCPMGSPPQRPMAAEICGTPVPWCSPCPMGLPL